MTLIELATVLVREAFRIQENEIIEITLIGEKKYFDFLDEFTLEVSRLGAFPTIRLNSPSYRLRYVKTVPEKYLRRTPPQTVKWIQDIQRHISIIADRIDLEDGRISQRRKRFAKEASSPILEQIQTRTISRIYMPTAELAKHFRVPIDLFTETVMGCLDINYNKLRKQCKLVADEIRRTRKEIVVSTGDSHTLRFRVGGRPVHLQDGSRELPGGSVFVSPIESTVNGSILLDNVGVMGKTIKNLILEFSNGKLVSSSAERNHKVFQNQLEDAYGDKKVFAGFGIGVNYGIKEAIGCEPIDVRVFGSIHVSLGSNIIFGGENFSDLFWRLPTGGATVVANKTIIVENGIIPKKLRA